MWSISPFTWILVPSASIAFLQYTYVKDVPSSAMTFLICLAVFWVLYIQTRHRPVVARLFLCRFPLLCGLVLLALPVAGITFARPLLGSLFVVTAFQIGVITFLIVLVAWSVMITCTLIQRHAALRFGADQLIGRNEADHERDVMGKPTVESPRRWSKARRVIASFLLHIPIVLVALVSSSPPWGSKIMAWVVGVLLAIVCLGVAVVFRELFVPPDDVSDAFLDPIPATGVMHYLHQQDIVSGNRMLRTVLPAFHRIFGEWLGPGYYDYKTQRIRSGHLYALSLLLVSLVIYVVGYFLQQPTSPTVPLPAMGYLLLLLLLVTWWLSGASFFLDRYRVPTIFVVVGLFLFNYSVFGLDHYFELSMRGTDNVVSTTALDAKDVFTGWLSRQEKRAVKPVLVVIAASGGGIQASAWTSQILTGLQEEIGPIFSQSIGFISAVSGGAVGSMYYLDRLYSEESDRYEKVREAGRSSSLEATAWGLTYPDLLRLALPYAVGPVRDRGWAIEQAWRRRLLQRDSTIHSWTDDVRSGKLPAFVFNATFSETGKRLLITPIEPLSDLQAKGFFSAYGGRDISMTTAARLAATFPYVSPQARVARSNGKDDLPYHIGDGGYFDNFGVMTVVEWLQLVLPQHSKDLSRVLIIEIRAYPEGEDIQRPGNKGWVSEFLGPLTAIMSVRASTQPARNNLELELLRRASQDLPIESVVLSPTQKGPLSWQLTDGEICSIQRNWRELSSSDQINQIKQQVLRGVAFQKTAEDHIDDKCVN